MAVVLGEKAVHLFATEVFVSAITGKPFDGLRLFKVNETPVDGIGNGAGDGVGRDAEPDGSHRFNGLGLDGVIEREAA